MSNPEFVKSYDATGTINPYRFVKFDSADYNVIQGAAATDSLIGASTDIAAASGERVDVIHGGIASIKLGGTVARGGLVTSDASGQGVAAAPASGANNRIGGMALASGVSGDIIPVLLSMGSLQGA